MKKEVKEVKEVKAYKGINEEQTKLFIALMHKAAELLKVNFNEPVIEFSTRASRLSFSAQQAILNADGTSKPIAVIPFKSFHSLIALKLDIISIILLGSNDFKDVKDSRYFGNGFKDVAMKYGFICSNYSKTTGYRIENFSLKSEAEKIINSLDTSKLVYGYTDNKSKVEPAEKTVTYKFRDDLVYRVSKRLPAELDYMLQNCGCKIFENEVLQPDVICVGTKKGLKYVRQENK